jgi:hypothetical protein
MPLELLELAGGSLWTSGGASVRALTWLTVRGEESTRD